MTVALVGGLISLILLGIDLLTKALADGFNVQQTDYFLGIMRLKNERNPGIAWSMFGNNPVAMNIITAITILMIIGIAVLYFTYFKKNTPARITLAVIEAGAVGNLIDRLYFGEVRDFINIKFLLPEYTCNLADMFIVLGAIALVIIILFIGKDSAFPLTKKWREEAKAEEAAHHAKHKKS